MSGPVMRVVTAPARLVRGAWRFVDPPLRVGRIPFARTVFVLQVVAALTFLGYTLIKKDVRLPFTADPYMVEVILPDARGLDPQKEPAVGVAGVPVGQVVEVEVEGGQARVTMRLDPEMRGKVFNDATAFVRPTTVLQTLIVNILPGDRASGALEDGGTIPAARTDAFVHIDELTAILDADTQAQVQVLIQEAARAFDGREGELRRILGELGRLTDGATPLAEALADRRRLLSRLTVHLDELFATLGERGGQLGQAIELGNRTLAVTAEREPELAAATHELAPALLETQRALAATGRLAEPLVPALDELIPAAGELGPAASGLRALAPELDRFVGTADRLVSEGRRPVGLLAEGMRGQDRRVRGDQIPALRELIDLVDLLYEYRFGMIQFADTWSGTLSTNRRAGTYAQQAIINTEFHPEDFGLGAAATQSRPGRPTRLGSMLAELLERTCRDGQPSACLMRFNLPGLPAEAVVGPGEEGG